MGAWIYAPQQAGSAWLYAPQEGSGAAGPVLSAPFAAHTGPTSATGEVTTDTAGGTLYSFASPNPTESASAVKASGTPSTVAAAGRQNVSYSALSPASAYYTHYLHSVFGSDSAVASSASFITPALAVLTTDVFRNWAGNALLNQTIENTVVLSLGRTLLMSLPNQVTNSQGRLVLSGSALQVAVPVIVVSWNTDGSARACETYTPS